MIKDEILYDSQILALSLYHQFAFLKVKQACIDFLSLHQSLTSQKQNCDYMNHRLSNYSRSQVIVMFQMATIEQVKSLVCMVQSEFSQEEHFAVFEFQQCQQVQICLKEDSKLNFLCAQITNLIEVRFQVGFFLP